MIVANKARETVANTKEGVMLTIADFQVEPHNQAALVMYLCRMVKLGELKKISKGKYYKPKKSVFGELPLSSNEAVRDLLQKGRKTIGYITGTQAFAQMGLTTQISSSLMVGTNKYRRPIMRGDVRISFLFQPNPIIAKDIPLLRILDAIRLFKDIPATSPDDCIRQIIRLIEDLPLEQKKKLLNLAKAYAPFVRAIVGAIFESTGQPELADSIRRTLNGLTNFRLPISLSVLPNKKTWKII